MKYLKSISWIYLCFSNLMSSACLLFCPPGLFQHLPPESREFEEVVKLLSTFYLDATSRATFTYTKASLIHNELLEKEVSAESR